MHVTLTAPTDHMHLVITIEILGEANTVACLWEMRFLIKSEENFVCNVGSVMTDMHPMSVG